MGRRDESSTWLATRRRARVGAMLTSGMAVLPPVAAFACPSCFGASSERVLSAYWMTAAGLSLLPLVLFAIFALWLRRVFRVDAARRDPAPETR